MLNKITSIVFRLAVLLLATATFVWLMFAGHASLLEGLLMAQAAILTAIVFGFRSSEGFGPAGLSIREEPRRSE